MNGTGDSTGPGTSGLSPQGLVIDPATEKLYVHNYMSRSVSIFDIAPILNLNATSMAPPTVVTVVPTVSDKLFFGPANKTVLRGKQVFYNSSDPRMSRLNYISCAGCHLDGAADMRVWDFTNRGEGLRNTVVLQGRGGTAHGNVHWSANFDEIQDFENDIRNAFGGAYASFPALLAAAKVYVAGNLRASECMRLSPLEPEFGWGEKDEAGPQTADCSERGRSDSIPSVTPA
jgi:hypothetical protein